MVDPRKKRYVYLMLAGFGAISLSVLLFLALDRINTVTAVLKNVKDPLMVKELIHRQVEEMKIKRRVRFGEIMTDDGTDDDLDDDI